MENYKLLQWYPSLYDDIEVETIVDYENGWIYYINKRGNKTAMEMDEEELSHKDFWELLEEQKPLFITHDGVKCFDRDEYIAIGHDFCMRSMRASNCDSPYSSDVVRFKNESNADEYIWRNKRVFSYKDIQNYGVHPVNMIRVEQLAKERSEE